MRIVLAQINPTVGALKHNQQMIMESIALAKSKGAQIVAFPELAVAGYPPEDLLYKDHFVADNLRSVKTIAKKTKGIIAIVGFVDRDKQGQIYNAAAIISAGKIQGVYHKEHLPNYGVFDEKRYFQKGIKNQNYLLNDVCFGVNICEDIWIDNATFQRQAKDGVQIAINISSSPFDAGKYEQRLKLIKSRAKKANVFVAYVNLVGGQDELVFDGGSVVVDSKGKVVASLNQFEENLLLVDVPIKPSRKRLKNVVRLGQLETEANILPKALGKKLSKIERIHNALVLGTHDYICKNGFKKVCIGLSGGIDSAVVAALAVDAVGKENVIGITMPSDYSSSETRSDAKALAENLGIEFYEIPIKKTYQAYLDTLVEPFAGSKPNVAEENIQARIRGNILMAMSNKFGWLVLTTGNKSELAVGYCTLYGDMSGGFAVIKDVPKTVVYELAKHINRNQELIPQTTITRAPSAELRDNQKDQDSLPEYDVLDSLLEKYVEGHKSFTQMSKTVDEKIVKDVIRLVDRNEYKRRQSPPGIKISQRAFGKDWRLPLTNKYKEYDD